MSKVGKGGKSPVICEVCPDHVRHGQTINVGHKLSGTPRVIHDRSKCRKRWQREKERIMARWPENRVVPVGRMEMPGQGSPAVLVHKAAAVGTTQRPATHGVPLATYKDPAHMVTDSGRIHELRGLEPEQPVLVQRDQYLDHVTEVRKEEAVQLTIVSDKLSRKYVYKPELDEFIVEHFKRYSWRRGAAAALHVLLQSTRPELLVDERGVGITQGTLSSHVSTVLAKQTLQSQSAAREVAEQAVLEQREAAAQEAAALGGRIASGIMALVARGDVATLKAVADLMDGR